MAELWVKLSVNAPDDEKILDVGDHAELVFYRSLCLAKRRNSDGVIARAQLRLLGAGDDDVKALVEADLWSEIVQGWMITAWFKHNRPAAEIEAEREHERERKREHRRRHASRDGDVPADATRDTPVASAVAQSEEQSEERVRVSVPADATRDTLLGRLRAHLRKAPNCSDPDFEAHDLLDQFPIEILTKAFNQSVNASERYASDIRKRAQRLQASAPRPARPQCEKCSGSGQVPAGPGGTPAANEAVPCPECSSPVTS